MNRLADFLLLEITVFVFATAALVFFKILTGRINTTGLLNSDETGLLSMERVQSLFVTVGLAGYIASRALTPPFQLPELPEEAIALALGSQLGYLGLKGWSVWFASPGPSSRGVN